MKPHYTKLLTLLKCDHKPNLFTISGNSIFISIRIIQSMTICAKIRLHQDTTPVEIRTDMQSLFLYGLICRIYTYTLITATDFEVTQPGLGFRHI